MKLPFGLLTAISMLSILTISCVKEEIVLDENISVPGLDPSFAAPIAHTSINLGNLEQNLDSQNFIYSESDQLFAFSYNKDIHRFSAEDLVEFNSQNFSFNYSIDAALASEINSLSTGSSYSTTHSEFFQINTNNSEELDSVILKMAVIETIATSYLNQDIEVGIQLPGLSYQSNSYSNNLNLIYPGNTPVISNQSDDVSYHTLDLTQGSTTNNTLEIQFELTFTKTSENVSPGDVITFDFTLIPDGFQSIWGYLGTIDQILDTDTQGIDLFNNLNEGTIGFADPKINLSIYNSAGLEIGIDLNGVLAPENSGTTQIQGPDLDNIPVIQGATNPGEVNETVHTIDNSGTSPSLSQLLEEGPADLVYNSEITTNPQGYTQNFILDTSSLSINAEVVLPLFLYADNFTFTDTMDVDLDDALDLDSEEVISDEDIEAVTLRLVADNGLPVDLLTQVYLTDSNSVVLDSLFGVGGMETILQSGLVNFSLSVNDPDYGKVYAETRTVTDVILTQDQIDLIREGNVHKVIIRAVANTSQAGSGEYVKFYPEYSLGIKLSGKVDTNIEL